MWTPIRLLQFFQLGRHFSILFYAFLLPFLGFSSSEIGSFEWLQLLGFALSFFWVSGLIQGLVNVYPTLPDYQKASFLSHVLLVFIGISGLSILILTVLLIIRVPLILLFEQISYSWIYFSFFLVNTPAHLLEYFLFLENKFDKLKWFCTLSFPFQIAFFSIPIIFTDSITSGIVGLFLWSFLRLVFLIRSLNFRFTLDVFLIFNWVRQALPLIFSAWVGGLATVINAGLVKFFFNGNAGIFAIYRYGARELPFLNGLFEGLGIGIVPSLVHHLQDGLKKLKENTRVLIHLIFPISIILMLWVDYWFPFLFSDQFEGSIPIFKIFLFLTSLRLIPTNPILNALGRSKIIAFISLAELVIHICCSVMGLKWFGLMGIAYATCIAYLFEKSAGIAILWRSNKVRLYDFLPVEWWLFYTVLLTVSYFINL
jgi:O-antigen/teichoic acid export membrane protein